MDITGGSQSVGTSTIRIVVVSGASRGLGLELALEAARLGCQVLGICRGLAAPSLKQAGIQIIQADCSDGEALTAGLLPYANELGNAEVLVINNAGVYVKKDFLEHRQEDLLGTLDSNFLCGVLLAQKVSLYASRYTLLNIVSTSALPQTVPHSNLGKKTAYGATKTSLAHAMTSLRASDSHRIRVINFFPRNINTWSDLIEPDSMQLRDFVRLVFDTAYPTDTSFYVSDAVALPVT